MKIGARLFAVALLTIGVSGAQQRLDPAPEASAAARGSGAPQAQRAGAGRGAPATNDVRQQLIGSYKLISYVSYDQNGAERKMPYVHGQISYDAAGRMSAQLMGSDRPQLSGGGGGAGRGTAPSPEVLAQRAALYSSYVSYFGRYTIDAEKGIVTHHVEGSLTPGMVGSDMPRWYEFSADGATLFLMTKNGDRTTGRLRWDRYK
jgi:lipocalin-like protein